jgi:hypothetical protein
MPSDANGSDCPESALKELACDLHDPGWCEPFEVLSSLYDFPHTYLGNRQSTGHISELKVLWERFAGHVLQVCCAERQATGVNAHPHAWMQRTHAPHVLSAVTAATYSTSECHSEGARRQRS